MKNTRAGRALRAAIAWELIFPKMRTSYIDKSGNICYYQGVRIIARSALRDFYSIPGYNDSKESLEAWYHEAKSARWQTWAGIKEKYGSASILKNKRVVFNICGNKYRLIVQVNYEAQVVYIRFIGTHQEYDRVNAEEI
jgi:mRNA interferase HigB